MNIRRASPHRNSVPDSRGNIDGTFLLYQYIICHQSLTGRCGRDRNYRTTSGCDYNAERNFPSRHNMIMTNHSRREREREVLPRADSFVKTSLPFRSPFPTKMHWQKPSSISASMKLELELVVVTEHADTTSRRYSPRQERTRRYMNVLKVYSLIHQA